MPKYKGSKPKVKSVTGSTKRAMARSAKTLDRPKSKPRGTAAGRVKLLKAKGETRRANEASLSAAARAMAPKPQKKSTPTAADKKRMRQAVINNTSVIKALRGLQKKVKKAPKKSMTPKSALKFFSSTMK